MEWWHSLGRGLGRTVVKWDVGMTGLIVDALYFYHVWCWLYAPDLDRVFRGMEM